MSDAENQGCIKMKIIEYHDYKTLMGPCFISFSIPLLVPGVVLTVVGTYGNESSFPTFGAWHIAGISILTFATLLLISGIVLKCCYRPVISADIEQHLSPTSSMITGSKNLGYENDIYGSKSSNFNNKVSHHDSPHLHRVVSTHESKTTNNSKRLTNKTLSTKDISEGKDISKVKTQQKEGEIRSNNVKKHDSSIPVAPPPSYSELETKANRKKRPEPIEIPGSNFSSSVARTMHGQVQVTASIVAEAETVNTSGSRDQSSDGGTENTQFLEKKRKKKKRRKRKSNLSQQSVLSGDDVDSVSADTSTRQVHPELRARPVLIHDGSEHHHHDLHVHFQEAKEDSTLDTIDKEDIPKPAIYYQGGELNECSNN